MISEREGARSFDKAMLTLSAGALGLSITFIHNIAPNPQCINLLIISWCFFTIALLCTLSSFLTSQFGSRKQRKILDNYYKDPSIDQAMQKNCYAVITNWLNIISLSLFIIGVFFMLFFSYSNLIH